MTNIVIVVRGGIVSEVYSSDQKAHIQIIDWDCQDQDELEKCEKENRELEFQQSINLIHRNL